MGDWFKDWFNTPYYHILYKSRDTQEAAAFIDNLIEYLTPPTDSKFLDVACGKGRHSINLNSKGYDVTGMDISPQSIAEANTRQNPTLRFFVADMRKPFADNEYDIALNLFTSFGYFEDRNDNVLALQNILKALKPNGIFVLDYFNAEKILSCLVPQDTKVEEGIEFNISKQVVDGRIVKTISFEAGGRHHTYTEKVEAKTKADFEKLFDKAGFIVTALFGDYQLRPFDAIQSDRLIFVLQKPAI